MTEDRADLDTLISCDFDSMTGAPELEICYLDDLLVVVNKPAGMLVHRSGIDARETVFLMQTLRDQLGQHVFPVHRLDKPTSGLVIFALSSEIARELSLRTVAPNLCEPLRKLALHALNGSDTHDSPFSIVCCWRALTIPNHSRRSPYVSARPGDGQCNGPEESRWIELSTFAGAETDSRHPEGAAI